MFARNCIQLAIASLLSGYAVVAAAQAAAAETGAPQRIEITGSSIRRIDAETALPVTVVQRDEIARSGVTSTEQLLQSIAAVSSAGGTVNATGAGTSTGGLSSISLRGLKDTRTLVLVNGRRLAAFATGGGTAVNINSIPLAAIERVEVLKDGASSLYGSDAVAGVVNFILSRSFEGFELTVGGGEPSRSGGGKNANASFVAGLGNLARDRFGGTVSLSIERDTYLFAKDRNFAKTGNVLPYLVSGATGQGNIEGAYTPGTGLPSTGETGTRQPGFGNSPGFGYGNPLAASNQCEQVNMFLNPDPTSNGTPYCAYDSAADVALLPKRNLANLSGNFVLRLGEGHELFSDLLVSRSDVTQRFQPSPLRRSFLITDNKLFSDGIDPVLLIRPNNPNYQLASDFLAANGFTSLVGQPLAVTARVFDFGMRTQNDVATQGRLVLGGRGSVAMQDYEVALIYNHSHVQGRVPEGYFSQAAYAKVVNAADSDYNPWSLTQSATFNQRLIDANAKYTGDTQSGTSKSTGLDAKLTGDFFAAPGGMSQYAVGAQYREEGYMTDPSPALQSGDIAGLGGAQAPIDRQRKVSSVFAELNVPIVHGLEGNLSTRYDKYSAIGNATTYKASARWAPNRVVVIRAAAGSGFRAPTLEDLYLPQTLGTSEQFNDPATGQTNLQVPGISGGNPDLKPEKSRQRSIGLVLSPITDLTMAVDFFRINMRDVITVPSAQLVVSRFRAGDPSYAGLVRLSPSGDIDQIITVNSNTGSLSLSGADLDIRSKFGVPGGRLELALTGTYMQKFDEATPSGSISHKVGTIIDENGDPVLGAEDGGVVLRWKHLLRGTYFAGDWTFTLAQNFASSYEAGLRVADGVRNFIPSFSTYDAQLSYSGVKQLRITLGVRNLFDKSPPIFTPASNQFQQGYDITQYDPRARFVYASASYRF